MPPILCMLVPLGDASPPGWDTFPKPHPPGGGGPVDPGWGVSPPVDPGYGHPGWGPVDPSWGVRPPVDPGYGRPGWSPVDPGYGRPGWSPVDPGYGRPGFGAGHPSNPIYRPPVDPGYGRPGWSPVDPGYGRPGWAAGHPSNPIYRPDKPTPPGESGGQQPPGAPIQQPGSGGESPLVWAFVPGYGWCYLAVPPQGSGQPPAATKPVEPTEGEGEAQPKG